MNLIDMQRASAVLVLALGTTLCAAQTAPAKPSPKPAPRPAAAAPAPAAAPADEGKTLSMGNSKGNSKVLTREELRACFKQRDLLQDRLKVSEAARAEMDGERAAIGKEQETLKS